MNVQAGDIINQYQIIDRIGEGGMGVVYLADDTRLQRKVALKFVTNASLASSEEITRFQREARATARLNHPYICTVYELGETDDKTYIAMEYVDGITLKERMQQGHIEEAELREWLKQLSEGLQAAHEAGVIHRDIKPANIMITKKGRIKIMDFGIAKLAESETELTQANSTIGTIAYMSPEQARGDSIDQRTDIWSVGVILYELVTGQRPFAGAFREAVMYAMMHEDVRTPSELNPDVPEEIEQVIKGCLQRELSERIGSLEVVVDILEGRGFSDDFLLGKGSPRNAEKLTTIQRDEANGNLEATLLRSRKYQLVGLGSVGLLMLVALFIIFQPQIMGPRGANAGLPSAMHLAVLPFDTFSEDPEEKAFSNGLAHLVAVNLTRIENDQEEVWIIPVREVLSQEITSANDARDRFGVNLVISGTIISLESGVQITLDLTDARTLHTIDTVTIELTDTSPQSIQDKVVQNLGGMLGWTMPDASMNTLFSSNDTDPEAFKLYIQGQGFMQRYENTDNMRTAVELFEKAIRIDSSFALAYAEASRAMHRMTSFIGDIDLIGDLKERAEVYSQKALSLDDQSVEVWIAAAPFDTLAAANAYQIDPESYLATWRYAWDVYYKGDLAKAEILIKEAIALQPEYWDGYNAYGIMLGNQSRFDEAIKQYNRAIELSPDNAYVYYNLALLYYFDVNDIEKAEYCIKKALDIQPMGQMYSMLGWIYLGRGANENAVESFLRAVEFEPDCDTCNLNLGRAYLVNKDTVSAHIALEETIRVVENRLSKAGDSPYTLLVGAMASAWLGQYETARSYMDRTYALGIEEEPEILSWIASTYESMQERDKALSYFERAAEKGYNLGAVEKIPNLVELWSAPRFKELVRKYEK